MLFALATPASAELAETPSNYWGVTGLETDSGTRIPDAEVWAIEQIGNTMYVGGRFLEVQGGSTTYDQSFLAAFDADTGKWIDWWRPDFDGAVWALEASADGSRLFVGGRFTEVNGESATGVVALDPTDGSIDASYPIRVSGGAPASVRVIQLETDGKLYIAGNFTAVGYDGVSTDAAGVFRINATSGALDTLWTPTIQGSAVYGLDYDATRDRVYLTGLFDSVNDDADTRYFAVVNDTTGATSAVNNPFPIASPIGNTTTSRHHDVIAVGDKVWVAGTEHALWVLNASDLSVHGWHYTGFAGCAACGGGDFQDLELVGDRIYASCHCGVDMKSSYTGGATGTVHDVRFAMAFDANTGEPETDYYAGFTGAAGPWAIKGHSTDGCVWFGGDMTTSGGTPVKSLVRQCDTAGAGPAAGPALQDPATIPVAPLSCTVSANSDTALTVTWDRANNDNADDFIIRRSRDGGSFFWVGRVSAPGTSFVSGGLAPGTYRYTVETLSGSARSVTTSCGPTAGVEVGAAQPAVAPLSCWATNVNGDIRVTWSRANNDNATTFVIRRSRDGGAFYWTGKDAASPWTNTGLANGTYEYTVETVAADGSRATKVCGPTGGVTISPVGGNTEAIAPNSCWATKVNGDVRVTWSRANNDNATDFVIRRSRNGGSLFWSGKVASSSTVWTNTNLGAGTYEYTVETVSADGTRATKVCGPTGGVTF